MGFKGGCLCGKVRYSSTADPVMTAVCHCRNCQKQAGTAFSVIVAVPRTVLNVSGPLKDFLDKGDSGLPVHRNFCSECGSPITTLVDAMPDLAFVKAGTLDDTSKLNPTMEIFCSSAQGWTQQAGTQRQQFAKGPS
jgi:hypothetical protein